ncbi:MAG: glycosyltransferase family 2 protein [Vicinamibacterales bacterium]
MTASVIIATWNRADRLDDCLGHLIRQDFLPGDEVIVADNGSTDHTARVVARHATRFPVPLTRLVVPTPGKSHAVAAALDIAGGDLACFTDDDVRVGGHWLAALRRAFADPAVGLAGGPVEPRWEVRPPRWLALAGHSRLGAPLGLLDYGPNRQPLGRRTLLGANLAVRRHILVEIGGYATHLGKLRGTLLSGEDHELCDRVQAAGHEAWYEPSAPVAHWVPADRMRLVYFIRWFFWSGITHSALDAGHGRTGVVRSLAGQFARGLGGSLAAMARGQVPHAVDRALDSAFAAGYAAARAGIVRTPSGTTPQAGRS